MALTAQNVVDDVRGQIKDEDANNYRWTDAKLLGYLSLAQTEVVKRAPEANIVREAKQLTAGQTLQTGIVPAEAIRLLDVPRNMGANGSTPGAVINEVSLEHLDRSDRNWHTATAVTEIEQWVKHPSEPRTFFCYPPAHASTAVWVEIVYSKIPAAITLLADAIGVHESYRQQLEWYVAGQALLEDEPHADFPRGAGFMSLFYKSLGVNPPR